MLGAMLRKVPRHACPVGSSPCKDLLKCGRYAEKHLPWEVGRAICFRRVHVFARFVVKVDMYQGYRVIICMGQPTEESKS